MSLQEKNSILSTFCRNDDNFVLQCLRIGSHFLKWQIVKSKYSHNLAENKIAPIASRETHNVICTKRALVIMCSCKRLVCTFVQFGDILVCSCDIFTVCAWVCDLILSIHCCDGIKKEHKDMWTTFLSFFFPLLPLSLCTQIVTTKLIIACRLGSLGSLWSEREIQRSSFSHADWVLVEWEKSRNLLPPCRFGSFGVREII